VYPNHRQDPGNIEALDSVSFHVGHKASPALAVASEIEDALQRHYQSGESSESAASSRPEFQNVPELLMFELKAQAATPSTELDSTPDSTREDQSTRMEHPGALNAYVNPRSEMPA
jgi:hypothetical protein